MQRFYNKILKSESGCWLWQASSRGNGYGAFKYKNKTIDAHRVSWILHYGEIPENMHVCHKCDIRRCVNPSHLFLGTHSDNMKDCYKKKRMTLPEKGRFIKGNTPSRKIYSDNFVQLILDGMLHKGKMSFKQLSNLFGVSYQFIRDLNRGRTYRLLRNKVHRVHHL